MPARPDSLLWWRAGIVSAMTFLVGAAGHVSGGGLLPSWFALAAMLAVGTAISAVVLARPASARRIVALVVLGQTACHALLSITAGHAGDADAVSPAVGHGALPVSDGARVGSLQDHYEAMVGTPASGSALSLPDPGALLDHLPMFLAHTGAALLVGLWLAAGERALWALLTLALAAVVALLVMPTAVRVVARGRAPIRRRPATLPSLARVTGTVVRRGPPALLAA